MEEQNDLLSISIFDYINNNQTLGALQIDGPWGSGKTHYIKNVIIPLIEKNEIEREKKGYHKRTPLIISLFGLNNIDEISRQILFATTHRKFGLSEKKLDDLKNIATNVAKCIPYLKNFDWDKAFQVSPSSCLKHLGDDIIIFLDDLERVSEDIKTEDILGFVNDLIENYNFKVILISNQNKIKNIDKVSQFREKVVDKTIPFEIDTFSIIKKMAESYNPLLPSFIESEGIKCFLDNHTNDQTNNTQLSNLRTIRFALNQFGPIFNYFVKETRYEDIPEITLKKLFIIWRFTLAISIEFRMGNISLDKKNNLENAGMLFRFSHLSQYKEELNEENKEKSFEEKFIESYYEKFELAYLYIPEIYDYILKGGKIDFEKIDIRVSKELGVWEDDNMGEELSFVNKFPSQIHYLSDENAPDQFLQFLEFISKGYAEKISDFIYAASIMMSYKDVANIKEDNIISKVNNGIDIFISKIDRDSISAYKQELEMYCYNVQENSKPCLRYALDSLEKISEERELEYISTLNKYFNTDMKRFSQEFMPYQIAPNVYQYSSPILHLMDLENIERRIKSLSPLECEELHNMLHYRFGEGRLRDYSKEKPFIEAIKRGLNTLEEQDKSLSAHFKRTRLVPIVNKLLGE